MKTQASTITRRRFLSRSAAAAGALAGPWLGQITNQTTLAASPDQRKKIAAAIPGRAYVRPRKKRKLLIFTLNVGYGGHGSIATANEAFRLMGEMEQK